MIHTEPRTSSVPRMALDLRATAVHGSRLLMDKLETEFLSVIRNVSWLHIPLRSLGKRKMPPHEALYKNPCCRGLISNNPTRCLTPDLDMASPNVVRVTSGIFIVLGLTLAALQLKSVAATAPAAAGPCSSFIITLQVSNVAQIATRLDYSPNQTVNIVLLQDISLTSSLIFDSNYSCTIFTSLKNTKRKIRATNNKFPTFQIRGTNNVLVQNVGFEIPPTPGTNLPPCPVLLPNDMNTRLHCPAVLIHESWGIQLVQAVIKGRIDIRESPHTTLDSLQITSSTAEKGMVQVSQSGDGPSRTRSEIVISNCNFTGSQIGLLLVRGAVGVTVRNNYFRNQNFTGVQCGAGVVNVGDCMLGTFVNNYFTFTPDFTPQADSSAMYFGTHWVNPGNYISCNYVVGGKQCLYLDYASSGTTVDGMVCIGLPSGLKLNTGHSNAVSSFITIGARLPGWISCQNYFINNCNQTVGAYWDATRLAYYDSPDWERDYPWLNNFCDLTSFNGQPCNPDGSISASITGRCSGLPTGNSVSIVNVDPISRNTPTYLSCTGVTSVTSGSLNDMDWLTLPSALALFNNPSQQDYGVDNKLSPIYLKYPNFKSCPKSQVGIKSVSSSTYMANFNVPPGPAVPPFLLT